MGRWNVATGEAGLRVTRGTRHVLQNRPGRGGGFVTWSGTIHRKHLARGFRSPDHAIVSRVFIENLRLDEIILPPDDSIAPAGAVWEDANKFHGLRGIPLHPWLQPIAPSGAGTTFYLHSAKSSLNPFGDIRGLGDDHCVRQGREPFFDAADNICRRWDLSDDLNGVLRNRRL